MKAVSLYCIAKLQAISTLLNKRMDDREDGEFLSDQAMDAEELSPYQLDDLYDEEDDDTFEDDDGDSFDSGGFGLPIR